MRPPHTVLLVRPDGHLVTALSGVRPAEMAACADAVRGGAHGREAGAGRARRSGAAGDRGSAAGDRGRSGTADGEGSRPLLTLCEASMLHSESDRHSSRFWRRVHLDLVRYAGCVCRPSC